MVEENESDALREMVERLMPEASADEQLAALENLRWYVGFVRRQAKRLREEREGKSE